VCDFTCQVLLRGNSIERFGLSLKSRSERARKYNHVQRWSTTVLAASCFLVEPDVYCESQRAAGAGHQAVMLVTARSPADPKAQIARSSSVRARMPVMCSARRLAIRCYARRLSSSASASNPGRRKHQPAQQPIATTQETSNAPGDSTWWSDPSSGERRRVKLSKCAPSDR
jgi:hypothetical protein